MSEFKVTQKMKVVKLHEQTLKQCMNPSPTPKIAPQGPKKSKMTPKLSQNQTSELKETKKMKVVKLHEQTPKQLSNLLIYDPIKQILGNKENESCSATLVDPKSVYEPFQNPKIAHQSPKKSKMTSKLSQIQMSE